MTGGVWAAPGRVNIIGEHTDYNNGFALPIALERGATCAAQTRAVGGVELSIDSSVPVGAGLSSSAAVTCAVAAALRDLFAPDVPDAELIDIARAAENDYVGAPTGTLDQTASVLCAAGHALLVDFGAGAHAHVPFDLAEFALALLVVDTNTPHQHADGAYAARRRQCEAAAQALGVASLRDIADARRLDALDPVQRRRARHVLGENERVLTVAHMLRTGRNPRAIGPILTQGHASLRDDFEVSAPQLDAAVEAACEAGAHGARMVGGGFGGSVIALVDRQSAAEVASAVESRFVAEGFAAPRSFIKAAAAGARRVS